MRKVHAAEFRAKVLAEVAEKKLSIPTIAAKHGLNNSIIYAWLGRTKGKKAAPEAPPVRRGKTTRISQDIRGALLRDINSGMTIRGAALKHKVNVSTVYGWVRPNKRKSFSSMGQVTETYKVAKNDDYLRDVATYLKHARSTVNEELRSGKIRHYDHSHLLMMLALSELEKNGH